MSLFRLLCIKLVLEQIPALSKLQLELEMDTEIKIDNSPKSEINTGPTPNNTIKSEIANELAEAKKEMERDLNKCTPIHDAAFANDITLLTELMKQKNNSLDTIGCFWQMTPIQYVIFKNERSQSSKAINTIAWLLSHGATKLEHKDSGFERTALHLAAMYNQPQIINLLMQYKANPAAEDIDAMTPFHLAAQYDNLDAVKALVNNGVSISIGRKDPDIKAPMTDPLSFPIHIAAYAGSLHVLDYLVNTLHQDINVQDQTGNTPLHYAAVSLKPKTVAWLLMNGADKSIRDETNKTALNQVALILKGILDRYKQNKTARENRSAFQNFLQDSITEHQKNMSKKFLHSMNIEYPEEVVITSEEDIRNHPIIKLLLGK